MKKLLFTAIAVIAFSGVSMAETTAIKSQSNVEMQQIEATPCQNKALDTYEWLMDNFYSGGDNINLLNALLSNCQ